MFNLSAAEGPRFAEIATEMTERVRALGPSEATTGRAYVPPPSPPAVEANKKKAPGEKA
jgi:hypothetical protein